MTKSSTLRPWVRTSFELLQHADEHRRGASDFDRRMALIGFDNSIEVSVTTYLSLNPTQRGGREYARAQVDEWKKNFHTKLAFLELHAQTLGVSMEVERIVLAYYHGLRNDLYHAGNAMVPTEDDLLGLRRGAIWAFSTLFQCDGESMLDQHLRSAERDSARSVSMPQAVSALSDSTMFLQAFVDVKEAAEELLGLLGNADRLTDLSSTVRATGELDDLQPDSSTIIESLALAERAKELILKGETFDDGTPDFATLSGELETVAARLKSRLREHQHEIAMRAMDATLVARTGNRCAGIVTQAVGSGLSTSLLGYLALCAQHPKLRELRVIVITDRRLLATQFAQMYHEQDLFGPEARRRIALPDGKDELASVLLEHAPDIVVTTVQQLALLNGPFMEKCLVVGYDLQCVPVRVRHWFPRGISILFCSKIFGSLKTREKLLEVFGENVYHYTIERSVRDGFSLPVRVMKERRTEQSLESDPYLQYRGRLLSETMLRLAVRVIVRDMADPDLALAGKAVILVPNLDSCASVINVIEQAQREGYDNHSSDLPVRAVAFNSREMNKSHQVFKQFCEADLPNVAVMTLASIFDLALPIVGRCFVLCAVPLSARHLILSLVNRHRPNKVSPYIRDFVGNDWNLLAGF
ncbi:hypothetical protein CBA19CS22_14585 [Caballeronia novacaledonica]|uniref:Uncharacterized protein n=1 Tax=Caballeronia novacaledonica TaxID=1544861 RepID=A0ACB5QRG8_9BURK|nr:hypothetical protein CBA19CS22_14585 [Caballeronia novacaledonica]